MLLAYRGNGQVPFPLIYAIVELSCRKVAKNTQATLFLPYYQDANKPKWGEKSIQLVYLNAE